MSELDQQHVDVTCADCAQAAAVLRDENGHIWDAKVNERVAVMLDLLASGAVRLTRTDDQLVEP